MLYWICPECGHECSPAIRECPTCTAAEATSPALDPARREPDIHPDVLALVENLRQPPAMLLLTAASQPEVLASASGSFAETGTVLVAQTTAAEEARDNVVRPLVESAASDAMPANWADETIEMPVPLHLLQMAEAMAASAPVPITPADAAAAPVAAPVQAPASVHANGAAAVPTEAPVIE